MISLQSTIGRIMLVFPVMQPRLWHILAVENGHLGAAGRLGGTATWSSDFKKKVQI
jgi:hypothetical protein